MLAGLLSLAEVEGAAGRAGAAVDRLRLSPGLRRSGQRLVSEVALRSACATARLEGVMVEEDYLRVADATDPVVAGALRVATEVVEVARVWPVAPWQALARLHLLAARGLVDDGDLGRPSAAVAPSARWRSLATIATGGSGVPAVVEAAIVHGELLALEPFSAMNGVVARAAERLVLIARGCDPEGLSLPEVGHLKRGPEYRGAFSAYRTGTRDGVRAWIKHCCVAIEAGAGEVERLAGAERS